MRIKLAGAKEPSQQLMLYDKKGTIVDGSPCAMKVARMVKARIESLKWYKTRIV
ncbi:hypothetical protein [Metabacillus fastidiosus]|uniref:Uncharacterized protein n=1 Tax=Metabacillus fastidiosus TaxID=1458 RepID=A0ABU6P3L1_9BACI|nr:hypothetical protein [Metabacillus fastidiosus]